MDLPSLLPIMLSWAVQLSDYPPPAEPPELVFAPHAFFVEHVCGGRECRAVGWYNDQDTVYIDTRLRGKTGSFPTSLLVHELVHYLQHQSGRFDSHSCADSIAREREAYHVQNSYLIEALGSFRLVRPAPTRCAYPNEASEKRLAGFAP